MGEGQLADLLFIEPHFTWTCLDGTYVIMSNGFYYIRTGVCVYLGHELGVSRILLEAKKFIRWNQKESRMLHD